MKLENIVETVTLNADIITVWNAVATKEGLSGWWMDNNLVAEEGKAFTLHAGNFGDSPCEVLKVIQNEHLSFKWGKDWQLAFDLKAMDTNTTTLTMTHSGWDDELSTEFNQPHTQVRGFMAQGWTGLIQDKLPIYIEA